MNLEELKGISPDQLEDRRRANLENAFKNTYNVDPSTGVKIEPLKPTEVVVPVEPTKPVEVPQEPAKVVDDERVKLENLLKNTFQIDISKGNISVDDAIKIAKHNIEIQKLASKNSETLSQRQKEIEILDKAITANPRLHELVRKALNGENVETVLSDSKEQPKDNPTPNTVNDNDEITEDQLVKSGYLDSNKKNFLDAVSWEREVFQAHIKYLQKELPKKLSQRALNEFQNNQMQIDKQSKETQETQRLISENQSRYDKSFNKAVLDLGFSITEHEALLPEINAKMRGYRDPNDLRLQHPEAFQKAVQDVFKEKNIQTKKIMPVDKLNDIVDTGDVNFAKRAPGTPQKPQSYADMLRQKRVDDYEKEMKDRKQFLTFNKK